MADSAPSAEKPTIGAETINTTHRLLGLLDLKGRNPNSKANDAGSATNHYQQTGILTARNAYLY
jgi:hypothetical protein